jgi:hypothetical protein
MSKKMKSIVNWKNFDGEFSNFNNRKPTKWAFIEELLDEDFYEKLYETYPKLDDSWDIQEGGQYGRLSYRKFWKRDKARYFSDGSEREHVLIQEEDSRYSESWNEFMKILWSKEFVSKLSEMTGFEQLNLKHMNFMYAKKNGFQNTHIHNASDKTLIVFVYFSKNWKKGDPGGTFLSDGIDFDAKGEKSGNSKIIFEPHNLDNTSLIVLDGPYAAHGMRKITKDVERRGIQVTYQPFNTKDGWYDDDGKTILEPLKL